MKIALIFLLIGVALLVVVEVGLRLQFGFGNPLIYVADQQIGYLLAPNQKVRRFGSRININEYSMRSASTSPVRPEKTLRVLLLGDSIANGGWWTDQDDTISELIERQLQLAIAPTLNTDFTQVEVLNASANSWSPRNELAYLQRFGHFSAQAIVLLINTDDLFGTAPTSIPVGRDRNYPDHKPPLALAEVFNRYVISQPPIPEMEAVTAEPGDRVGFNLEAIQKISAIAHEANSQLLLVMTPLLREVNNSGPRAYELEARQRLIDFTQAQQIPYLDFLPIFKSTPPPKALYRDHIHLSLTGNQLVTEKITQALQQIFLKPKTPST